MSVSTCNHYHNEDIDPFQHPRKFSCVLHRKSLPGPKHQTRPDLHSLTMSEFGYVKLLCLKAGMNMVKVYYIYV